jgi:hypothetical protein
VQREDLVVRQDEAEIEFEMRSGEIFVANPPYKKKEVSGKLKNKERFERHAEIKKTKNWGSYDYVSGWFLGIRLWNPNKICSLLYLQIQFIKDDRLKLSREFSVDKSYSLTALKMGKILLV